MPVIEGGSVKKKETGEEEAYEDSDGDSQKRGADGRNGEGM